MRLAFKAQRHGLYTPSDLYIKAIQKSPFCAFATKKEERERKKENERKKWKKMDACKVRYASTYIRRWMEIGKEVRTSHSVVVDDDDDDDGDDANNYIGNEHDEHDDDVYYAIKWIRNLITAPQIAHRNSRRKILISYTIPLFSHFFFVLFALNIFCISFLSRFCARFLILFSSCRRCIYVYVYVYVHIFRMRRIFSFSRLIFLCTLNVPFDVIPKRSVPTTYYKIYFYGKTKYAFFLSIVVVVVVFLEPSTSTMCCNACKYSNYALRSAMSNEILEKMANMYLRTSWGVSRIHFKMMTSREDGLIRTSDVLFAHTLALSFRMILLGND